MKIQIKILGTGCTKCKSLENLTKEVVAEHNFDAQVSKVDDIIDIMSYNVISTPALVINEKVVLKGYLPGKDEIKKQIEKVING